MTPVQLVNDLEEDLKKVLSHIKLPSYKKKESGVNIFKYGIPVEKTNEDIHKKFPYILIIPKDGNINEDGQKVSIHLLIGLYDDGVENQGKQWVLNVINDICERFSKNPVLSGNYYTDKEMDWVVDIEEEYPFHYGEISLVFNVPAFGREDRYA